MHHIKCFELIILIICFALVTFGCVTGKNQQANTDVSIKTEVSAEGIELIFDYIPPETNRIFIHFSYWGEGEQPNDPHQYLSSYSDIMDTSLEQVKQCGKVIFPFVQAGFEYQIVVSFQNADFEAISGIPELINTVCIAADDGIYLKNDIELELNEDHTCVTLSCEPVFSKEVYHDKENYSYVAIIYGANIYGADVSLVEKINDLSWDFEPQMTNGLKNTLQDSEMGKYLVRGTYAASISVLSNIIYDNIKWEVEIAKSSEFTFTL